jgi:hypothetical protein
MMMMQEMTLGNMSMRWQQSTVITIEGQAKGKEVERKEGRKHLSNRNAGDILETCNLKQRSS